MKEYNSAPAGRGESYPNFKKLTALLNEQRHPRRSLRALVSVCKPPLNGGDHGLQKSQILI